ncbi:MAG: hypothetical protein OZSIB_4078 [Candidatus Ozemobacter sibiricus]|uniref:Uncharacterized protein n=1 Tax=Candidatus Ozemobacter sibiricus TaxID=2268124 RepID=A0A367ZNJ8_9BACT|nr:MAG: hypothetical protein OZSIB_4078 [Candidatus Ozemobacter sibiricus]
MKAMAWAMDHRADLGYNAPVMEEILLRPFHRGTYECLWAEHRYALLAVSLKKFRQAIGKLGRTPHVLAFLASLRHGTEQPWAEWNHALLSIYDHVKEHLDRPARQELIDRLLAGDPGVPTALFELGRRWHVAPVLGCRLFFPRRALYKFYDFGDQPGLWVCLGPMLIHLGWGALRARWEARTGMIGPALDERLATLAGGLEADAYVGWPLSLREVLEDHAAVAITPTRVWLHPRLALPLPPAVPFPADPVLAGWAALERAWDADPGLMPALPSFAEWRAHLTGPALPELVPPAPDEVADLYADLLDAFYEQQALEHGARLAEADGDAAGAGRADDEAGSPSEGEDPLALLDEAAERDGDRR